MLITIRSLLVMIVLSLSLFSSSSNNPIVDADTIDCNSLYGVVTLNTDPLDSGYVITGLNRPAGCTVNIVSVDTPNIVFPEALTSNLISITITDTILHNIEGIWFKGAITGAQKISIQNCRRAITNITRDLPPKTPFVVPSSHVVFFQGNVGGVVEGIEISQNSLTYDVTAETSGDVLVVNRTWYKLFAVANFAGTVTSSVQINHNSVILNDYADAKETAATQTEVFIVRFASTLAFPAWSGAGPIVNVSGNNLTVQTTSQDLSKPYPHDSTFVAARSVGSYLQSKLFHVASQVSNIGTVACSDNYFFVEYFGEGDQILANFGYGVSSVHNVEISRNVFRVNGEFSNTYFGGSYYPTPHYYLVNIVGAVATLKTFDIDENHFSPYFNGASGDRTAAMVNIALAVNDVSERFSVSQNVVPGGFYKQWGNFDSLKFYLVHFGGDVLGIGGQQGFVMNGNQLRNVDLNNMHLVSEVMMLRADGIMHAALSANATSFEFSNNDMVFTRVSSAPVTLLRMLHFQKEIKILKSSTAIFPPQQRRQGLHISNNTFGCLTFSYNTPHGKASDPPMTTNSLFAHFINGIERAPIINISSNSIDFPNIVFGSAVSGYPWAIQYCSAITFLRYLPSSVAAASIPTFPQNEALPFLQVSENTIHIALSRFASKLSMPVYYTLINFDQQTPIGLYQTHNISANSMSIVSPGGTHDSLVRYSSLPQSTNMLASALDKNNNNKNNNNVTTFIFNNNKYSTKYGFLMNNNDDEAVSSALHLNYYSSIVVFVAGAAQSAAPTSSQFYLTNIKSINFDNNTYNGSFNISENHGGLIKSQMLLFNSSSISAIFYIQNVSQGISASNNEATLNGTDNFNLTVNDSSILDNYEGSSFTFSVIEFSSRIAISQCTSFNISNNSIYSMPSSASLSSPTSTTLFPVQFKRDIWIRIFFSQAINHVRITKGIFIQKNRISFPKGMYSEKLHCQISIAFFTNCIDTQPQVSSSTEREFPGSQLVVSFNEINTKKVNMFSLRDFEDASTNPPEISPSSHISIFEVGYVDTPSTSPLATSTNGGSINNFASVSFLNNQLLMENMVFRANDDSLNGKFGTNFVSMAMFYSQADILDCTRIRIDGNTLDIGVAERGQMQTIPFRATVLDVATDIQYQYVTGQSLATSTTMTVTKNSLFTEIPRGSQEILVNCAGNIQVVDLTLAENTMLIAHGETIVTNPSFDQYKASASTIRISGVLLFANQVASVPSLFNISSNLITIYTSYGGSGGNFYLVWISTNLNGKLSSTNNNQKVTKLVCSQNTQYVLKSITPQVDIGAIYVASEIKNFDSITITSSSLMCDSIAAFTISSAGGTLFSAILLRSANLYNVNSVSISKSTIALSNASTGYYISSAIDATKMARFRIGFLSVGSNAREIGQISLDGGNSITVVADDPSAAPNSLSQFYNNNNKARGMFEVSAIRFLMGVIYKLDSVNVVDTNISFSTAFIRDPTESAATRSARKNFFNASVALIQQEGGYIIGMSQMTATSCFVSAADLQLPSLDFFGAISLVERAKQISNLVSIDSCQFTISQTSPSSSTFPTMNYASDLTLLRIVSDGKSLAVNSTELNYVTISNSKLNIINHQIDQILNAGLAAFRSGEFHLIGHFSIQNSAVLVPYSSSPAPQVNQVSFVKMYIFALDNLVVRTSTYGTGSNNIKSISIENTKVYFAKSINLLQKAELYGVLVSFMDGDSFFGPSSTPIIQGTNIAIDSNTQIWFKRFGDSATSIFSTTQMGQIQINLVCVNVITTNNNNNNNNNDANTLLSSAYFIKTFSVIIWPAVRAISYFSNPSTSTTNVNTNRYVFLIGLVNVSSSCAARDGFNVDITADPTRFVAPMNEVSQYGSTPSTVSFPDNSHIHFEDNHVVRLEIYGISVFSVMSLAQAAVSNVIISAKAKTDLLFNFQQFVTSLYPFSPLTTVKWKFSHAYIAFPFTSSMTLNNNSFSYLYFGSGKQRAQLPGGKPENIDIIGTTLSILLPIAKGSSMTVRNSSIICFPTNCAADNFHTFAVSTYREDVIIDQDFVTQSVVKTYLQEQNTYSISNNYIYWREINCVVQVLDLQQNVSIMAISGMTSYGKFGGSTNNTMHFDRSCVRSGGVEGTHGCVLEITGAMRKNPDLKPTIFPYKLSTSTTTSSPYINTIQKSLMIQTPSYNQVQNFNQATDGFAALVYVNSEANLASSWKIELNTVATAMVYGSRTDASTSFLAFPSTGSQSLFFSPSGATFFLGKDNGPSRTLMNLNLHDNKWNVASTQSPALLDVDQQYGGRNMKLLQVVMLCNLWALDRNANIFLNGYASLRRKCNATKSVTKSVGSVTFTQQGTETNTKIFSDSTSSSASSSKSPTFALTNTRTHVPTSTYDKEFWSASRTFSRTKKRTRSETEPTDSQNSGTKTEHETHSRSRSLLPLCAQNLAFHISPATSSVVDPLLPRAATVVATQRIVMDVRIRFRDEQQYTKYLDLSTIPWNNFRIFTTTKNLKSSSLIVSFDQENLINENTDLSKITNKENYLEVKNAFGIIQGASPLKTSTDTNNNNNNLQNIADSISQNSNGNIQIIKIDRISQYHLQLTASVSGATDAKDISISFLVNSNLLACIPRSSVILDASIASDTQKKLQVELARVSSRQENTTTLFRTNVVTYANAGGTVVPQEVMQGLTTTSTVVASVAALTGSPSALQVLQRKSHVNALKSCSAAVVSKKEGVQEFGGDEREDEEYNRASSPLALSFTSVNPFSRGTILGNIIIGVAAGIGSWIFGIIIGMKRNQKHLLTNPHVQAHGCFPGVIFTAGAFLTDGVVGASMFLILGPAPDATDIALASVGFAFIGLVLWYFGSRLFPRSQFFQHVKEVRTFDHLDTQNSLRRTDNLSKKCKALFVYWFIADTQWISNSKEAKHSAFIDRFGSTFDGRRKRFYAADYAEAWISLLIAIGSALAKTASSVELCIAMTITVAFLVSVAFALALQLSFAKPIENLISVVINALIVGTSLCTLIVVWKSSEQGGSNSEASSWFLNTVSYAADLLDVILVIVVFVSYGLKAIVFALETAERNAPHLISTLVGSGRATLDRNAANAEVLRRVRKSNRIIAAMKKRQETEDNEELLLASPKNEEKGTARSKTSDDEVKSAEDNHNHNLLSFEALLLDPSPNDNDEPKTKEENNENNNDDDDLLLLGIKNANSTTKVEKPKKKKKAKKSAAKDDDDDELYKHSLDL